MHGAHVRVHGVLLWNERGVRVRHGGGVRRRRRVHHDTCKS